MSILENFYHAYSRTTSTGQTVVVLEFKLMNNIGSDTQVILAELEKQEAATAQAQQAIAALGKTVAAQKATIEQLTAANKGAIVPDPEDDAQLVAMRNKAAAIRAKNAASVPVPPAVK